tara:strand:- start:5917 stop:7557 length:1641 start_codon:yes stop_codon:yes gene_type:complete
MALKDLLDNVEKNTSEKEKVLKSIGENFMALSGIARDLNVAGQNLAIVLEGRDVDPSKKQDAFFLKEEEREKKLEVELGKDEGVTQVTSGKKKKSFFESLKDMLKPGKIFKILVGVLAIGGLMAVVFKNFKDEIMETMKDIPKILKEKFTEYTQKIKDVFINAVESLKEKVKPLYEDFAENVGEFFSKIGERVTAMFSKVVNFFSPVVNLLKKGYELVMSAIKKIPFADLIIPKTEQEKKKEVSERRRKKLRKQVIRELKREDKLIDVSFFEKIGARGEDAKIRARLQEEANQRLIELKLERKLKAIEEIQEESGVKEPKTKPTPITEDPAKKKTVTKIIGDEDIKAMIKQHEGYRDKPYKDSEGLWTIGYGHLIGDGKSLPDSMNRKFSKQEIDEMFEEDYAHHKKIAERTPGYNKANYTGQAAMIDLGFNMGKWWPEWPVTSKALREGNFTAAARGLEDSQWYGQVGIRAPKIVAMIEQGDIKGPTGDDIASGSSSISAAHSQQRKPKTPMIVNNISNNNRSLNVQNDVIAKDNSSINPSENYA